MSTVMYYTGINPANMKPVYVCKNPHEKAMQRALIQYKNPKNYDLVYEALIAAHREDLIGFDKKCLIKPRKIANRSTKEKVIQQGKRKAKDSMQNNKNNIKQNNIKNKAKNNVHQSVQNSKNGKKQPNINNNRKNKIKNNAHKKSK